jgi:peptidoglycan/xylan/chitin deacetylase (PgdA/CDA1 family)
MLALTFDDGPDPQVTPAVLDALRDVDGRGTFFMLGGKASENPQMVLLAREREHVVACHGMDHRRMLFMRREEIERNLDDSCAAIAQAAGGGEPVFFRPPYGHFSAAVGKAAQERGMVMVLWTALSGDFEEKDPEKVYLQVEPFIRPGAIIVFHDTVEGGGVMLPGLIRRIAGTARDRNIRLGGIDELAAFWADSKTETEPCS